VVFLLQWCGNRCKLNKGGDTDTRTPVHGVIESLV